MQEITGYRGSGKTVELVRRANDSYAQGHKVMVLVSKSIYEDIFRNYGLDVHIPVVTYSNYKLARVGNKDYQNVDLFIDEISFFLRDILGNNVACITSDLEDQVLVKREDWDK